MRVLRAIAFLAVLSVALAAPVAIVSASAKFKDLKPSPGDTYKYLYYVTNSSWSPSSMRWNCNNGPGFTCTSNCGTSTANGPQCKNPTVPYNAPFDLMLDTFPWQVRWGNPVSVDRGGSGLPSGFGFRGTYNQGIDNIYQKFWVGEAVHFNNPIWSDGGNSDSWTIVITLYITDANGQKTQQDFDYKLRLDETLNQCETNDGCPWSSTWWKNQDSSVDTRPDCPALTEVPRLPGSSGKPGKQCCRYITLQDLPCADRVWTLDALDQSKVITVGNKRYTLNIKGFSVPGNDAIQKDYFISQEKRNTRAEIYANLVDACPTSCPSGQVIVQDTICKCVCPAPDCPAGQVKNASCGCECPANATNCGAGSVVVSGNSCICNCAGVTCPGSMEMDPTDCSCKCPTNICGTGAVRNPNDPTCPCQCPTCPPGQQSDARCSACACPPGAKADCEALTTTAVTATYNDVTCECSVCSCPDKPCATNGQCPVGTTCVYENSDEGAACAGTDDLCIARCGPNGECVFDAIVCELDPQLGEDLPCWSTACDSATGDCVETWNEDAPCTLAALDGANVNTPCLQAICKTTAAGQHCVAVPVAGAEGSSCPLVTDDRCNAGQCVNGECKNKKLIDQPCSDGKACTYLAGYVDPITGSLSDACREDPTNPDFAVCSNDTYQCSDMVLACHTIACIETAVGALCQATPVPFNTSCNDGTECTVNDVCQRQLVADPDTGEISWVDNGVCEGYTADCSVDDPCVVGRCIEGGGCVNRTDVRDGFICGVEADNCTIWRCDNGTCSDAEDVCGGGGVSKGAIAGAAVAGAAALALAVAIGLYARSRIANSKVFDPTTWEQLQAGAGTNNPVYERRNTEGTNALYGN